MLDIRSDTDLLHVLRAQLVQHTQFTSSAAFALRGIWQFSLRYRPSSDERLFRYNIILCQSVGDGICYSNTPLDASDHLLGKDARHIADSSHEIMIALLDSAFASIPLTPCRRIEVSGSYEKKAIQRATVVADVVDAVAHGRSTTPRRVLNIGAIGHIIRELQHRSYDVIATDLDSQLITHMLHGVTIQSGSMNMALIPTSDVVVASGMTLATHSLTPIAVKCCELGIPCVIVAETGAHLAPHYKPLLGLAAVISEPFPFYTFAGTSAISVYASAPMKGVVS